ncbi:hypothetical protein AB0I50_46860, partial [Streptomyces prunicolor]
MSEVPLNDSKLVGKAIRRREDPRLLAGRGRFVDDIALPGMLHAQFVRSTVAHAELASVDVSAVLEVPGVVAVFTAEDLELGDIVAQLGRWLSVTRPPPPRCAAGRHARRLWR